MSILLEINLPASTVAQENTRGEFGGRKKKECPPPRDALEHLTFQYFFFRKIHTKSRDQDKQSNSPFDSSRDLFIPDRRRNIHIFCTHPIWSILDIALNFFMICLLCKHWFYLSPFCVIPFCTTQKNREKDHHRFWKTNISSKPPYKMCPPSSYKWGYHSTYSGNYSSCPNIRPFLGTP